MHIPKYTFNLFFFLLLILPSAGCEKDDPTPPITPDPPVTSDPPQYETPFASIPPSEDVVMYEINERAFSSSGTLMGILPRLDSIKALGVNVIWLMPIHPIGAINTVNSPYCVRNFKEVNPEYDNLENLRTLVREAHNRDMAVILDWVVFSNNMSEQALRSTKVKMRFSSLFRTFDGAQDYAILRSIIDTAILQGKHPFDALVKPAIVVH